MVSFDYCQRLAIWYQWYKHAQVFAKDTVHLMSQAHLRFNPAFIDFGASNGIPVLHCKWHSNTVMAIIILYPRCQKGHFQVHLDRQELVKICV